MSSHVTTTISDQDKKRLYDRVKGWTTESDYIRQAVREKLDRDDEPHPPLPVHRIRPVSVDRAAPLVNGKTHLVSATKMVLAKATKTTARPTNVSTWIDKN
jgi:hypothetical protein